MKKSIVLFFLLSTLTAYSQTRLTDSLIVGVEIKKILQIVPIQREGVDDEDFDKGSFILKQVQNQIRSSENPNLYTADYWNVTLALLLLQEDKNVVTYFFNRGIETNSKKMCFYVHYMSKNSPQSYKKYGDYIPKVFFPFFENCDYHNLLEEEYVDLRSYAKNNNLDSNLVKLIANIKTSDRKYRIDENTDWEKQTILDKENQRLIDSLYNKHGKYIGKPKVGDNYEMVMWLVVQHSNIGMMEKYLPIIQNATTNNEITSDVPLKMLIDRIYSIKHSYQIFGSQLGIPIANEKIRMDVLKKYNLE